MATKDSYWGTAALFQIGLATEQFARQLSNPPAITGAKREDVLKQLEPQIQQLNQAASNWYTTAQTTITKYRVYNSYSLKVINALARIKGSKVQFDDYVVQPDFMASQLPSGVIARLKGAELSKIIQCFCIISFLLFSCSGDEKTVDSPVTSSSDEQDDANLSDDSSGASEPSGPLLSGRRMDFVYSDSNNVLTSSALKRSQVNSVIGEVRKQLGRRIYRLGLC